MLPQLDITTFPSQLFWLGICFLSLYLIIHYLFFPKITRILENRETIREQRLNKASTYRAHAENLLRDYEKTLVEAQKQAHHMYQQSVLMTVQEVVQKKKEIKDKLEERLHIAEQELYRVRLEVSRDIPVVAQEIAETILAKLTANASSTHPETESKK